MKFLSGNALTPFEVLQAGLVCVALLYLVLRIPGIVHRFALRPMMDASRAAAGAAEGAVGVVADVAPRLLALL